MRRIGAETPRRATSVAARWFSLAAQTSAVVIAAFGFGIQLPLGACAAILLVSAAGNVVTTIAAAGRKRMEEREAAAALSLDLLATAALIFVSGGLANPFAVFLLAPSIVAGAFLRRETAIGLAALSVAVTTALYFLHLPLILADGETYQPPPPIPLATWIALSLAMAFIPAYVRRVAIEAFDLTSALAATQMALEQEQRISALGALSAAMAHELGTPLATIKLTASELKRELEDDPELAEDAALIAGQAERCREILSGLATMRSPDDAQIRSAPVMAVLEEAAEPHSERRADIVYRFNGAPAENGGAKGARPQPEITRRPELIHGLRNLIQNAADFAAATVWIDVDAADDALTITIGDDGAGFSADILDRLGEPFATTRGKSADAVSAYVGMGLGVFIAKTLLERVGARITFANASDVGARRRGGPGQRDITADPTRRQPTGALVTVRWSAAALDALTRKSGAATAEATLGSGARP